MPQDTISISYTSGEHEIILKESLSSLLHDRKKDHSIYTFNLKCQLDEDKVDSLNINILGTEYRIDKADIPDHLYNNEIISIVIDNNKNFVKLK